jgi:uncharacterized phosphosugar-binding protein
VIYDPIDSGITRFYHSIQALQENVIESQYPALERAAEEMVKTIQNDGRIFVFGSGHSHVMAEEAFYRAGGLAAAVPIFSSILMLHEKPALSSHLERTEGLAELLLEGYKPYPGEMLFIFSNSGVNSLPVEMALTGKRRGLYVVTVSSLAYARIAPLSPFGKRLDEAGDLAIDNGGEPGDALLEIEGSNWRVGPSSTIIGALIWNCLVAECAGRLGAAHSEPPVFASLNMPGAAEHNQKLLDKWRKVNPHL